MKEKKKKSAKKKRKGKKMLPPPLFERTFDELLDIMITPKSKPPVEPPKNDT